jgi:hypothetical protein
MERVSRLLGFDLFQPGILTRWLVKVAVDANITWWFTHYVLYFSTIVRPSTIPAHFVSDRRSHLPGAGNA